MGFSVDHDISLFGKARDRRQERGVEREEMDREGGEYDVEEAEIRIATRGRNLALLWECLVY